jgi:hypothetical protein
MTDEVTQDQSDLKGGFRWANLWSVVFFSLDSIVMIISLILNMCLVRAVARNRHKERDCLQMMSQSAISNPIAFKDS